MKKLLSILTIFAIVFTLGTPKRSDAYVGFATGDQDLALVGLILTIFNGGLLGIILLDEESQNIVFTEIPKGTDGIGENARLIYNSEREDLSLIANEIKVLAKTDEEAASMWDEARSDFSPETFNVLETLYKNVSK